MRLLLILLAFTVPAQASYYCNRGETDSQCATRYGLDNVIKVTGQISKSSGSSVRISDKLILTANHVTDAMFPLFDGEEGEWIQNSEEWDLDLYRLETTGGEYAEIGDIPPAGTKVYALGYPLGLAYTVTSGYWIGSFPEGAEYTGYNTAQIYPGNSGGALVYVDEVRGHGFLSVGREVKLLGLTNYGAIYEKRDQVTTMGWAVTSTYILEFLKSIP